MDAYYVGLDDLGRLVATLSIWPDHNIVYPHKHPQEDQCGSASPRPYPHIDHIYKNPQADRLHKGYGLPRAPAARGPPRAPAARGPPSSPGIAGAPGR